MVIDQYHCSPLQQAMLFQHATTLDSGANVLQLVTRYSHPVDPQLLERAWRIVADHHPVLRTSFRWADMDEPLQYVHDRVAIDIARRPGGSEADIDDFLAEDRSRGFDLTQPSPMRLTWFSGPPNWVVWTLHHILLDGRAMVRLLNEVEHVYGQLQAGETYTIEPGLPYRDYVAWVHASLDQSGVEDFWRTKLNGITAPTELPREFNPPGSGRSACCELDVPLGATLSAQIKTLAAEAAVTLNTVMMAAWAILLSRFSGTADVVFGSTKTTRRGSIPGAESAVGLFLSTLPVRVQLGPATTVMDLLHQIRAEWLSLRNYEHTPLVRIKSATEVPASAPLFESSVVFENERLHAALAAGNPVWTSRDFRWLSQMTFPLVLMGYGGNEITVKLRYDGRRYSDATARRILDHAIETLRGIGENPSRLARQVPVIPPREQEWILHEQNRTERSYPRQVPLAAQVEQQVARTPDAVAVVFGDERLTYAELNARANQLARELQKHGAAPEKLVGIFIERSLDMMVALLAVVKTGAGYVPLDPYLPAARLEHMIADSSIQVVVTQKDLASSLPVFSGVAIVVDEDGWRGNAAANLEVAVSPDNIAYVIYTSGSTGKPKGVQVPYGALINLLWSVIDWLGFTAKDRLLAVTTISFDIAGADVWMPWLVGAQTVVATRETAVDGRALQELLDRHDITFMQATPVTWWLLLGAGWQGKRNLQIVCTGEAMPRELAAKLQPVVERLWNLYGPTETTIWSTGYAIEDGNAPILIGRPVANTQCYILNEDLQPAPVGTPGELYIAGDGLARGYLNRPELTAEKFVANPFGPEGSRMYRTGDLARYLPDGRIECLGRTDHQVKIRGFRIELGEIETALKTYPGIKQAVVVAREDTPGNKRLVAYYVVAEGETPPERAQLRAALKAVLPEYMVPADYVALPAFPISPNGKIDRKALPAPEATEDLSPSGLSRPPADELERVVLAVFADVLGQKQLGPEDDFFDSGGHSLSAMRAVAAVNAQLGVNLPVRVLFNAQTAAKLAAVIREQGAPAQQREFPALIPIHPEGSRVPLFCVARPNVNALGYLFLARQLGENQPVWGLQKELAEDPELDFTQEQYETTAAEYIEAMRSVQPHGPYNLAAQCQGAYIAFEMARQLERGGETVAMMAMLDVWSEENTRSKALFFAHQYGKRVLRMLRPDRSAKDRTHLLQPPSSAPAQPRPGARRRLLQRYWPGPDFKPDTVNCPIVVFRVAKQQVYRIHDVNLGWGNRTTAGVSSELIPGDHMTFLREPYVKEFAEKLATYLARFNAERTALRATV